MKEGEQDSWVSEGRTVEGEREGQLREGGQDSAVEGIIIEGEREEKLREGGQDGGGPDNGGREGRIEKSSVSASINTLTPDGHWTGPQPSLR